MKLMVTILAITAHLAFASDYFSCEEMSGHLYSRCLDIQNGRHAAAFSSCSKMRSLRSASESEVLGLLSDCMADPLRSSSFSSLYTEFSSKIRSADPRTSGQRCTESNNVYASVYYRLTGAAVRTWRSILGAVRNKDTVFVDFHEPCSELSTNKAVVPYTVQSVRSRGKNNPWNFDGCLPLADKEVPYLPLAVGSVYHGKCCFTAAHNKVDRFAVGEASYSFDKNLMSSQVPVDIKYGPETSCDVSPYNSHNCKVNGTDLRGTIYYTNVIGFGEVAFTLLECLGNEWIFESSKTGVPGWSGSGFIIGKAGEKTLIAVLSSVSRSSGQYRFSVVGVT